MYTHTMSYVCTHTHTKRNTHTQTHRHTQRRTPTTSRQTKQTTVVMGLNPQKATSYQTREPQQHKYHATSTKRDRRNRSKTKIRSKQPTNQTPKERPPRTKAAPHQLAEADQPAADSSTTGKPKQPTKEAKGVREQTKTTPEEQKEMLQYVRDRAYHTNPANNGRDQDQNTSRTRLDINRTLEFPKFGKIVP